LVWGATVVPKGQSAYVFVGWCGRSVWYRITIRTGKLAATGWWLGMEN